MKRDSDWSSTTTVSLEHDVSKVLQETVPSVRSLGAFPKKSRQSTNNAEHSSKRMPKSESEKCSVCRCKPAKSEDRPSTSTSRSMKENKVTQTLRQSDSPSPVEGLECIVYAAPCLSRSLAKRGKYFLTFFVLSV